MKLLTLIITLLVLGASSAHASGGHAPAEDGSRRVTEKMYGPEIAIAAAVPFGEVFARADAGNKLYDALQYSCVQDYGTDAVSSTYTYSTNCYRTYDKDAYYCDAHPSECTAYTTCRSYGWSECE